MANGKCFEVFTDKTKWEDAQTLCEAESANLASIESAGEQAAVFGLAGDEHTWIGATGTATDSTSWFWKDSDELIADWSYTNWLTNYPKEKNNRDCVRFKKDQGGLWENNKCSGKHQYACSRTATECVVTTTTTTTTTTSTSTTTTLCYKCFDSWTVAGDKCFEVFTDKAEWEDAQALCEAESADLASIESAAEQDAVLSLAGTDENTWIGATGTATDSTSWFWKDSDDLIADWSFTNWMNNYPKEKDNHNCVRMKKNKDGQWDNLKCNTKYQYACSRAATECSDTTTTTTTTTTSTSTTSTSTSSTSTSTTTSTTSTTTITTTTVCFKCFDSWTLAGNKCFDLFTDKSEWSEAQALCEAEGADLASIESSAEQAAVFDLGGDEHTWIGATGTATDSASWYWQDSDDLIADWPYTNWLTNYPKEKDNQDCVRMKKNKDGLWDNIKCNENYQYICSRAATECSDTTTTTTTTTTSTSTTSTSTTTTSTTTTSTTTTSTTTTSTSTTTSTTSTTTITTTTVCFKCFDSWTQAGNKCFDLFTDKSEWSEAQALCEAEGADLASIESAAEQDAVYGLAGDENTWIGATTGNAINTQGWFWTDSDTAIELWSYENWLVNYPKAKENQDCVRFKKGKEGQWDNIKCNENYQYVCSKSAVPCEQTSTTTTTSTTSTTTTRVTTSTPSLSTTTTRITTSTPSLSTTTTIITTTTPSISTTTLCFKCFDSWTQAGNKCFDVFADKNEWTDAQALCEAEGADLASIESAAEQNAVFSLSDGENTWIGATGTATDSSTWYWNDSDELIADWSFTNWLANYPKEKDNQDCVRMKKNKDGQWDNIKCNEKYQYACSKSAIPCDETTTTITTTTTETITTTIEETTTSFDSPGNPDSSIDDITK